MSIKFSIVLLLSASLISTVSCIKSNCDHWNFVDSSNVGHHYGSAALLEQNLIDNGKGKRESREAMSGLFPFPRVGRAADKPLANHLLDQIKRRVGLIPFPRVGRSDMSAARVLTSPYRFLFKSPFVPSYKNNDLYLKKTLFLTPLDDYIPQLTGAVGVDQAEYYDKDLSSRSEEQQRLQSYAEELDAGKQLDEHANVSE